MPSTPSHAAPRDARPRRAGRLARGGAWPLSRLVSRVAALACVGLVVAPACQGGPDCGAPQGRVEARLRACGVTTEPVELGGCSVAFAAALSCQAACAEAAPCDALDGSSPAARSAYLDCVSACG